MLWRYPGIFCLVCICLLLVWPVGAVLRKDHAPASSASSAELRRTSDISCNRANMPLFGEGR